MERPEASQSHADDVAFAVEELGSPPVQSTPSVDLDRGTFAPVADTSIGGTVFVGDPPRLGRSFRGYDRNEVDDYIALLHREGRRLMQELITLRERHTRAEAEVGLSRKELAWWRAQRETLDIAVAKAHSRAVEVEQRAAERAAEIEKSAHATAERLVGEVREQAREVLAHAEEEARKRVADAEARVNAEQREAARLVDAQVTMARAVRGAMREFEAGIGKLEAVQGELGALEAGLDPAAAPTPAVPDTPGTGADDTQLIKRRYSPPSRSEPVDSGNGDMRGGSDGASQPADAAPDSTADEASATGGISHITLDVSPVTSFAGLTAVQQAIGDVDGIEDVFVRSFSSDTARLQFIADRELDLATVLPAKLPWDAQLDMSGERPTLQLSGTAVLEGEPTGA